MYNEFVLPLESARERNPVKTCPRSLPGVAAAKHQSQPEKRDTKMILCARVRTTSQVPSGMTEHEVRTRIRVLSSSHDRLNFILADSIIM